MATDDDNTDTMIAVGAAGGGALLLWWLMRGRRFGAGSEAQGAATTASAPSPTPAAPIVPPCRVFLRGKAIELNGATANPSTTVTACRAAGSAHLGASGDTTTGAVTSMARALNAAGVAIVAHPDIAEAVRDAITRVA